MSQGAVLHVLTTLGGRASTRQVRRALRDAYPEQPNYAHHCLVRLRALEKFGRVKREGSGPETVWVLSQPVESNESS